MAVPPSYTLPFATRGRARIGDAMLTAPFTTVTWARLPAVNAGFVPLGRRQCSWVPRCVRTPAGLGLHPFYRGWCLYVAVLTRAARGGADPGCHGTFEPCPFSGIPVGRAVRRAIRLCALWLSPRASPPGRGPVWRGVARAPPEGGWWLGGLILAFFILFTMVYVCFIL